MISRELKNEIFKWLAFAVTLTCILLLAVLVIAIFIEGVKWLTPNFITGFPSRFPHKAGIYAALWGTLWLITMTASIAMPIGIAAAVYLEEFAAQNRWARLIELNVANLAGTPSIVFGFIGLVVFVRGLGLGHSLWAGAGTLALLVLPMMIIATREAIKGVPLSIREGAYALGVTKWQCVWGQVLPAAIPGILTGIILAISRAIGETAPLIMIGALTYIATVPEGPHDVFTTLPIQIFNWASRPQAQFQELAAAGIIVLLGVLFLLNFLAFVIRIRAEKRYRL